MVSERMGYSLNDFSVGAAIWSGIEKRCRLYLRLTNDSWRVDETHVGEAEVFVPSCRFGWSNPRLLVGC